MSENSFKKAETELVTESDDNPFDFDELELDRLLFGHFDDVSSTWVIDYDEHAEKSTHWKLAPEEKIIVQLANSIGQSAKYRTISFSYVEI